MNMTATHVRRVLSLACSVSRALRQRGTGGGFILRRRAPLAAGVAAVWIVASINVFTADCIFTAESEAL